MNDRFGHLPAWDFSVEELTTLGRNGSLPPGYLYALHARQRALHARLQREIEATFAAAANDPDMLARLNRPL
jgi:hypothetical protein